MVDNDTLVYRMSMSTPRVLGRPRDPKVEAAILAAAWAWRTTRLGCRLHRLAAAAVWVPTAAMVAIAAPYWGWHGMEGWGPRLIVPSVALLAPLAAVSLSRWPARWLWAFLALSVVLNLAPLIQHPTPVDKFAFQDVQDRTPVAFGCRC